jgi:acylphosphatase
VRGEVWNRRDGAVEAVATHGDPQVLDEFVRRVRSGPGHVDDLQSWPWEGAVEEGFRIGSTR